MVSAVLEILYPQGLCQGSSLQAEPLALLPSSTAEPTDVPEHLGTVTADATSRPGQELFPLARDCLSASSCGYRWDSGAEVWLGGEQNQSLCSCPLQWVSTCLYFLYSESLNNGLKAVCWDQEGAVASAPGARCLLWAGCLQPAEEINLPEKTTLLTQFQSNRASWHHSLLVLFS